MEGLLFLGIAVVIGFPIIILVMLSGIRNRQLQDKETLLKRIDKLEETLYRTGLKSQSEVPTEKPATVEKPYVSPVVVQEVVPPPIIVTPPPVILEEPIVIEVPKVVEEQLHTVETTPSATPDVPPFQSPKEEKAPKEAKDFERFIGENLAGKIGIAILVLGIGYFVKYAIDREMISEAGRVALGLISGCILLAIAHRQRKSYRTFSSLLVSGGIATFYFTITIAFQQYQMFGQTLAFIIMVVITAFSVLLSVLYDRRELAAISLLGGLAAPFMVSTGQGNHVILFSYLLILNTGMLVLAGLRRWNIINALSFIGTVLIYAAWLLNEIFAVTTPHYGDALLFASLFFIVFFVMNILPQLRKEEAFTGFQTSILLFNSFLFFAVGMSILQQWEHKEYQGVFTALLATFNFIPALIFYRRGQANRKLALYLFGLVLVFVSLVAPVQLKGNYITLFWAAEAAMLLWFSRPAQMPLAKTASLLLVGLMMVSVVIDWFKFYGFGAAPLPLLANKVFITCVACFVSLTISRRLLRSHENPYSFGLIHIDNQSAGVLFDILMAVIAFGTLNFEGLYQMNRLEVDNATRQIVLMAINYLWVLALMLIVIFRRSFAYSRVVMLLGVAALLINCLVQGVYYKLFEAIVYDGTDIQPGFALHYINFFALAGIIITLFVLQSKQKGGFTPVWLWAATFFGVFIASAEVTLHGLALHTDGIALLSTQGPEAGITEYHSIVRQSIKAGYPVLWGICSFALMWLGMRNKNQTLRIISLTLFTLTLAKLFIYDISGVSDGGRIIAFIILGILLLVISFMYQKIKKIILSDEKTDS
jgi:uncharacterized membrane protein